MFELLKNRQLIRVAGVDAIKFLQNLVSNDIVKNDNSYNYLLSSHGRYLYDFFISKISNQELLLDIDSSCVEEFIKKLMLYKLKTSVQIEKLQDDYCVIYSKIKIGHNLDIIVSYQDPRFYKLGFRSIVKKQYIKTMPNISSNLYISDKYDFTIPDGICDLIFDRSIPSHFGGEELCAISFSKGCYVGQEVISRAKYQGVVRKKLFKIISDESEINKNLESKVNNINGDNIGILCSSYNNIGIALLDEEKYLKLDEKIAFLGGVQKVKIFQPEWR